MSYQQVVWQQNIKIFVRCHESAFESFSVAPKTLKIDNLKSVVLKAHLYEPELDSNYFAFNQYYDYVPLPGQVASPQEKGKVESDINYTQNNTLKGKEFDSLDGQNSYFKHWNKTWAHTRIHGIPKGQAKAMFVQR